MNLIFLSKAKQLERDNEKICNAKRQTEWKLRTENNKNKLHKTGKRRRKLLDENLDESINEASDNE